MKPIRHYARLTVECRTPLSIASGRADKHYDVLLARDANGLPVVPGTSIAGVLRHAFARMAGAERAEELFGYQQGRHGKPSRLAVTWGHVHDSTNTPVDGLITPERARDPLLAEYLRQIDQPMMRNRVRLNAKGVAADTGKFDRSIVPAGSRFTFELCLRSEEKDEDNWTLLLRLLQGPDFRLGGNTRAGLGSLKIVHMEQGVHDLREPSGQEHARTRSHQLETPPPVDSGNSSPPAPDEAASAWCSTRLNLQPTGYWRIGQGSKPMVTEDDRSADLLPVTERRVTWQDGRGKLSDQPELLVPATAIKGALRHRMAFHAARFEKFYDDSEMTADEVISALFGQIKENGSGHPGRLVIDDQYLPIDPNKHQMIMHNVIDRFTGGVRDHLLFAEEMLWDTSLQLDIRHPRELPKDVSRAFKCALDDLCEGRLALGGGSSRGHGFFKGSYSNGNCEEAA